MRGKRHYRTIASCLLVVLFCNAALYFLAQHTVQRELQHILREHLAVSLSDSLFSDNKGRVNDSVSIAYIARQINSETNTWIKPRWYAAIEPRTILIRTIDDIVIEPVSELTAKQTTLSIALPRNERLRSISISYQSKIHSLAFALITVIVVALVVAAHRVAPLSLTQIQTHWLQILLRAGYEPATARALVASWHENQLTLAPRQLEIFELLHSPAQRNFSLALSAALDARAMALTHLDLLWFTATLATTSDIDAAWHAATHEDRVDIDLLNARLHIRGRDVHVTKTLLFYYAWYALKRMQGDGWTLNPPSNRPDHEQGNELAALMFKYKGHAKAVSELEQHGLRAKTLDQNRSKIKEELLASLGPKLAEHYLFDTEKDPLGRARYRLKVEPTHIRVIDSVEMHVGPKRQLA